MGHEQSQNAMTEIALALAMAFFAIMVLAMISMGAQVAAKATPQVSVNTDIVAASLKKRSEQTEETAKTALQAEDTIVIHWQGSFYNPALEPIDVTPLGGAKGRIVLALEPGLSIEQALNVRSLIPSQNLIVSTLDTSWVERLRSMQ